MAVEPEAGQSASYYPVSVEEYTYGPLDELRINKAKCRSSSSMLGESWQYFVPNSSRETHRQTIRFLPFLAQVHRL